MKIFLDTNVVLDVLAKRAEFYDNAAQHFPRSAIPVVTPKEFLATLA